MLRQPEAEILNCLVTDSHSEIIQVGESQVYGFVCRTLSEQSRKTVTFNRDGAWFFVLSKVRAATIGYDN